MEKNQKRWRRGKVVTPFFILFALVGLLGWELYFAKPGELPSALAGKKVPGFQLPNLFKGQPAFSSTTLKDRIVLLVIWASWCEACLYEHAMLMTIKNQYHIPIYGIVYKDNTQHVIDWLNEQGNPYDMIGDDQQGDVAIDLGMYGTPETFVINAQGKIVYRYAGAITKSAWDNTLYPVIKQNG